MAGRGPAPKPKDQRRHRNAPARGDWVDIPPVSKPLFGSLPRRSRVERPWHPKTKRQWDAWRQDPATTQWGEADVAAAEALAVEFDVWAYEGGVSRLAEIRKWMDMLGLTQKGKRDNRWRVVEEEPSAEVVELKQVRRIRAVDPSA